ncbi:MAG: Lrp/AsnC family transcriptional regulator [Candidatus Paracaedibacter sp.]|jgi:DNA-binding Lrp family transcriptional regulator
MALDAVDLQILKDLQSDGRITNVKLAENAGISAPPCLRRVRALEEAGVIESYHAILNQKALGFEVTIFAQVGLSSQSDADLRAFEEQVRKWPLVRECHMIAGESDYLLKIVARNWDEYQQFHSNQLSTLSIITNIKSKLIIRTAKQLPGVPIDLVNVEA